MLLFILPVTTFFLIWPKRGLTAYYRVLVHGRPVEAVKQIDKELDFPNRQTFQTPIMLAWKNSKFGSNSHPPVLDVVWNGYIRTRTTGEYVFHFDGQGSMTLILGDKTTELSEENPEASFNLKKGFPELSVRYIGTDGFRITWYQPDSISRSWIWFWDYYRQKPIPFAQPLAGICPFIILLIEIVLLARIRPKYTEAALNFVISKWPLLVLILALGLTLSTRFYRYTQIPVLTETYDEYCTTLNGIHLVYSGYPSSWSLLTAYKTYQIDDIQIFKKTLHIVKPYFDHPPLYSIFIGLYLKLYGVHFSERFEHYFEDITRPISIFLSVINALLMYLLARKIFKNQAIPLMAVIFYAVLPTAVFTGRLVKEEHLILTCLLGSLLLIEEYLESGRRSLFYTACCLTGLTCMMKVPGLAAVGGIAAVLISSRKFKDALLALIIGIAFFSTYFLYGAIYDWDTFWSVLKNQSTHSLTIDKNYTDPTLSTEGLLSLIGFSSYVLKRYFSLTQIWLWLSFGLMWYESFKNRENNGARMNPIIWPIIIYLVFMSITMNSRLPFGWYRIPLYPFFAIAAGWWMYRMIKEPNLPLLVIFCMFPLWDAVYWGLYAPPIRHTLGFRMTMLVPVGLLLCIHLLPEEKRKMPLRLAGFAALIICFNYLILSILRRYYLI